MPGAIAIEPLPTLRQGPRSGLISAYLFHPESGPTPLAEATVASGLPMDRGWVWLHLNLADARARAWLTRPDLMGAPAAALFAQGEERLFLDTDGETVFGILADFERGLEPADDDVGRLRFAFRPGLLVTARRHALVCVDEARKEVEAGTRHAGPGAVLDAIHDRFADHLARLVADMTDDLDSIEDRVVSDVVENLRLRLVPIRRAAVRLRRQVAAQASVLRGFSQRLREVDRDLPLSTTRIAGRLEAIDGDLASLQERSKLRWSPFGGQVGGFAKLGSGLLHAASSMQAAIVWTSAGVRPPKAVWG
ncbi:MAG: CorA family divalent cation transporter, partial [Labrys sp. (in: a-proteobacteria)]